MSPALQAFIVFKAVDKATSIIRGIQNNLGSTMQRLENIKYGAFAMGGATFFAMKKMADSAALFQASVTPLRTVVTSTFGDIEKSINKISIAAKEWASAHKQSAEEFLKASYMMSSAGLNDIQAIEGTRKALSLATATMGDATEAANLIALAYNNFGNKSIDVSIEMTRLGDVLAKTQNLFQIANLGQLSEGLKYASSTALSAKISFEEMNTVIGMLNNVGLQGSMAGTAFSNAIAQMSKASKELGFTIAKNAEGGLDFITTLENIRAATEGMSSVELMDALNKAFGQEGARGIALLLNQLDKLKDSYEQVKNATGTLKTTQKIMESDFISQMTILGNNLKNIAITIGMPLVTALNKLVSALNPIFAAINWIMNNIPIISPIISSLIFTISGLATAIGVAAAVTSASRMGFALLFKKEFVAYVRYIKVLIAKIFNLIGVTKAWTAAQQAMGYASVFGCTKLQIFTTGLRNFFSTLFASMGPVGWIIIAIGLVTTAFLLLWKYFKPFRVFIINMINSIAFGLGWLVGLFTKIPSMIASAFQKVIAFINRFKIEIISIGIGITVALLPVLAKLGIALAMVAAKATMTAISFFIKLIPALIKTGIAGLQTAFSFIAKVIPAFLATAAQAIWTAITALPALIASLFGVAAAALAAIAPFAPFILAGIAVGALAFLIIKNWLKVKEFFIKLGIGIFEFFKNFGIGFIPVIGIPLLLIKNWKKLNEFFIKSINIIKNNFISIWNNIFAFAKVIFDKIKNIFNWNNLLRGLGIIKNNFISIWNNIIGFAKNIFNKIKNIFNWNNIFNSLKNIKNIFKNIINEPLNSIKNGFNSIWNIVINNAGNAFERIKSIFNWQEVFNGLKGLANAFISPINAVIHGLNTIKIPIPDWVPGIGGKTFGFNIPTIPALASGGYIASSGIALVGEQGPEIVSLPRGATVYSNKETKQIGETHYHTHYNSISINIQDINDIEDLKSFFKMLERYGEIIC
ncbi:MAG: phage tail tape measure protein [Candidatus Woesearchaeota archaeon]